MTLQRKFRILTVAASVGGASLAISGSAPTSGAAPLAAGLMRAEWTWTGADESDSWRPDCNWHPLPTCLDGLNYPDDPGDNATFPWKASGAWACDLIGESIGDLTLEGSVDFDTDGGTVTLSVTRLKIEATNGEVEITMNGTAQITVP